MMRITLGATAMLVALACAGCSGNSGSDAPSTDAGGTPTVEPTVAATPRSVPLPQGRKVVAQGVPSTSASAAARAVGEALAGISDALVAPTSAATALPDDVLAGAAREAVLAQAAEYADNGWTVSGEPRIVRMTIRQRGDRLRVRACVDQSAVVVTDATGAKLPRGAASDRTWQILTLKRSGDHWQVVAQGFPDDPRC